MHQERHHKDEIAKNGINAGIRGPTDNDGEAGPNSPGKTSDNGNEQRNSDGDEKTQTLTDPTENVKSEPKTNPLTDPMGSLRQQMGLTMPPTSQPMTSQPQRIPSFAPPSFPPTSLSGMTGFGLGGFGLPQPHFPAGFNPQLLAGLLAKPKIDQSAPSTPMPHFPLHMRAPETPSDLSASITEIDQSEPEKTVLPVSEPMETAQS